MLFSQESIEFLERYYQLSISVPVQKGSRKVYLKTLKFVVQ